MAVSKKTDKKWNSSTICGTASQKCGIARQKVEQVLKAGYYSTNCETVPQKGELFHFVSVFLDTAEFCCEPSHCYSFLSPGKSPGTSSFSSNSCELIISSYANLLLGTVRLHGSWTEQKISLRYCFQKHLVLKRNPLSADVLFHLCTIFMIENRSLLYYSLWSFKTCQKSFMEAVSLSLAIS